ncbi:class I SAM-dependent methyltransferase [Pedobacter steynii]
MANNNTSRFSNRVEDYVKYRPGYPAEIIDFLQSQFGLYPDKIIADVGAGTGISAELFLNAGYEVFAVEPNLEMREKAVELLAHLPAFHAINGTAENTTLETGSIDAVVAGQAFHWFDRSAARFEFSRILKPEGLVVLIWNERKTKSDFEVAYDELIIKHGSDYVKVDHRNIDETKIGEFFAPEPFSYHLFQNKQVFDFYGLQGRLFSSSYMPARGEDGYEAMVADLKQLFEHYKEDNSITIHYDTKVYIGRV